MVYDAKAQKKYEKRKWKNVNRTPQNIGYILKVKR